MHPQVCGVTRPGRAGHHCGMGGGGQVPSLFNPSPDHQLPWKQSLTGALLEDLKGLPNSLTHHSFICVCVCVCVCVRVCVRELTRHVSSVRVYLVTCCLD